MSCIDHLFKLSLCTVVLVKLGKIKTATQGVFSIENRDENTPYIKKVRVVTNVQYFLED